MNAALQNRLVGTIIVVALVVILLPELLDGEKRESNQSFEQIPPKPAELVIEAVEDFPQDTLDEKTSQDTHLVDEIALDDPPIEASDITAAPEQSDDIAAAENSNAQAPESAPAASPPEVEIQDSGYVVQLGSFRYEKNVNELIATLKNAGYRAYSEPVNTNVGVLNKVFVGPELERRKLEQALPHLEELTQLKGKITAFEVSAD